MRLLSIIGICTALVGGCACTSSGASSDVPQTDVTAISPTTATHSSAAGSSSVAASSSTAPTSTAPTSSAPTSPAASSSATDGTSAAQTPAQREFARMSEAQRVGQLIMVDCPSSGVAAATKSAIRKYHVGSVILDGNSTLSVAQTLAITRKLQSYATKGAGLFISTDQEGGLVRRMRGPGFSNIPSAVAQGTKSPTSLRASARKWGLQLKHAGINVDLAPVLDTVPSNSKGNPPIGDLDREYGHTPTAVSSHGVAVARGLVDAGIDPTVKHFPGLGRVSENTDTTSGVTDHVTTRTDAYLAPFKAAIKQINDHLMFVMMSTAIYSKIRPNVPAAFSATIITGILRHDLGFTGVVISDDVGSARQVSGYSPAARARNFVHAGGDIVLTVNPGVVAAMAGALLSRAQSSPAFKKQVDAAALRVLQAKQARGLLS